jgi:hypothetical protein
MRLGFGLGLQYSKLSGGGFEGMLDLFPNGSFAASIRKLKANYADDSTTVRRDNSDQLGIGFANNELNEPELVTFADGGDAFNVDFKDQTGNGRNFSQGSAASQPKIVNSGSVIKANTKPTLSYDGTNDHLRCPATDFVTPTDKLQVSIVVKNAKSSLSGNEYIMGQYGSGQDERSWAILIGYDQNIQKIQINFGNPANGTFVGAWISDNSIDPENLQTIGFTFDAGTVVIYVNGSVMSGSSIAGTISTLLFDSNADVTIGCVLSNNVAAALWEGNISEIYLADNLTDSIVEIQQNQMEYFNIN